MSGNMTDKNKRKKNKNSGNPPESGITPEYEAVRAYSDTPVPTDPLGMYTGMARLNSGELPFGMSEQSGYTGSLTDPVQPGIPGGKIYLNIKEAADTPVQDADDL